MATGGRKVDKEFRTKETLLSKEDKVAYNILYFGRTEGFSTADSDPLWQIGRTIKSGNIFVTTYANHGKYNCKWSDRYTYFDPDPPAENDPGVVTYPSGLQNGGRISYVTLNAATWTALPPVALANRNALSIQNTSGTQIVIEYDNAIVGYNGVVISPGAERFYSITDQILIYAKAQAGTPTITIEELS